MARIDFSKIIPLLESNEEFSLTEKQYLKSIGREMPKETNYLIHQSALAKEVKKYGYFIEVKERTVILKKAI
ncbi:MAG: hypothetical protein IJD09_01455 [Clostridia bacterium]|nr:hypothetical protein [Clostridia bacterium]